MSNGQQQLTVEHVATRPASRQVTIYSHSQLFYWWPVWVTGYIMALLTYAQGHLVQFQEEAVWMHASKNLGVIYTVVFFFVILITNVTLRGMASAIVMVTVLALTFMLAYFGLWDNIFSMLGGLAIHMNLGFYVFFSTAVFLAWALAFFFFDRVQSWTFRPGQMIHHTFFGTGEQTYDTGGMSVSKLRDDPFRHWLLGIGTGDIHVSTSGAKKADFVIPNVVLVGSRVDRIQQLVAMKPDELPDAVVAGEGG